MEIDYCLVAIDSEQRFVLRLLNLEHHLQENKTLSHLSQKLKKVYIEYILGSVILGNRYDDQEVTLFKLILDSHLRLNCEVSPKGAFRTSLFPQEIRKNFDGDLSGQLHVARMKSNKEVYQSMIELDAIEVSEIFQNYIKQSNQTDAFFWIYSDEENLSKNYAMWIERLPQTSDQDWSLISNIHQSKDTFFNAVTCSNDPDQIMNKILPFPFKILTVQKPFFHCGCTLEKVIDAIRLLSHEELVDIFMEGDGISTRCDYCEKIWQVEDKDIKDLIQISSTKH